MADFPLGSFSRPSDHGPDEPAATFECGWCGCDCAGEVAAECSVADCSAEFGECCKADAICACCCEPYCPEHLHKPAGRMDAKWCASCIKDMTCPRCGEFRDDIEEYDFGTSSETGYHDAGRACGDCTGKRSRS